MEVIVGENAGFCFGVKRAVDETLNIVNKDNKRIYCLGELVHNKEVIDKIEKSGVCVISSIDKIKDDNAKLIIRAHGVDKNIYEEVKKRNIDIIDLTCPLVSKIHNIAEEYKEKGYYIFLIGNKNHPEIIGTASHCGNNYSIIEDEENIEEYIDKLLKNNIKDLLVIVQTTYSTEKFRIIEQIIKERLDLKINIVIKNTICNATELRQIETNNLSQMVDLMIIIGGKNSSNTKKLYDISNKNTNSILIETAKEIELSEIDKYDKIGIMAGTSTPQESINVLVKKLKK